MVSLLPSSTVDVPQNFFVKWGTFKVGSEGFKVRKGFVKKLCIWGTSCGIFWT